MQVFNSLTRRNEELKPLEGNEIRLYTCGPTVYNFAHIGNFRAYAFEDILRRVVQFDGMKEAPVGAAEAVELLRVAPVVLARAFGNEPQLAGVPHHGMAPAFGRQGGDPSAVRPGLHRDGGAPVGLEEGPHGRGVVSQVLPQGDVASGVKSDGFVKSVSQIKSDCDRIASIHGSFLLLVL